METIELMLGDWVMMDNYPTPIQLGYNDLMLIRQGKRFYTIPLTAEILEKNRFIKIDSERYELVGVNSKGKEYRIIVYLIMGCFSVNNITDKNHAAVYRKPYCSELQNALHLCGLDDLADNFKV